MYVYLAPVRPTYYHVASVGELCMSDYYGSVAALYVRPGDIMGSVYKLLQQRGNPVKNRVFVPVEFRFEGLRALCSCQRPDIVPRTWSVVHNVAVV